MITPQDAINALISNGWTQHAIANKVGCTQVTVSAIGRGSEPKYALGVKIMALGHRFGKKGAKKP
jgi:transcriptional regulator